MAPGAREIRNAAALLRRIRMLPDRASICDSYWPTDELYKPNKQHWIGWLSEYAGPGYYGRKNSDRSAKFIYNHINSPPMLLWLNESARVSKELVRAACRVQAATQNGTSACSLIRRVLPWELVEGSLLKLRRRKILAAESGQQILHLTLHRRFFAEIAARTKRIEYRQQSPYWRRRLEGRDYDAILFRNGYARNAPEILVEFRGLRRHGRRRNAYYAIRLGRILEIKRWPKMSSRNGPDS
jgi:hypothetical protein